MGARETPYIAPARASPHPTMASTHDILRVLQVATLLLGCLSAAEVKVKVTDSDKVARADTTDDLDTQETVWMASPGGFDPFQKKLSEIEYVKSKLLSPFMSIKPPVHNYAVGYPVYSAGVQYPSQTTTLGARPMYWTKPVKTITPSYSQNIWYNKALSGVKYQPTPTYAPDCDHTSSWRPSSVSVSVPVNPTYSAGTPLNTYYSSSSPSQTYGTPLVSVAAKSTFSATSSQSGSVVPPSKTITLPFIKSNPVVIKSSDPQSTGGYQSFNPFSYWSSTGSFPSTQTWSGASGASQGQSSVPSWSGFSSFYPSSQGLPKPPAAVSSSSSGTSGFYPIPGSASQLSSYAPTAPSAPYTTSQSSYNPFSTYFPQGSQYTNPSSLGQQYFLVPSSQSSSALSDQDQVRIAPPSPLQLKSNIVSSLPGPSIALPIDSSVYSPGSAYVGSYYPNVFVITNEQHVDRPNVLQPDTDTSDQGRSVLQSSTGNKNNSSDTTSPTETSMMLTKSLSSSQMVNSPVQTTLFSSNTVDPLKFTVYSIPQPVVSSNGFYSLPVQGSYPIPVSSALLQASSAGTSQPLTRTSSVNAYPLPLGYRYNPPSIGFQTGFQTQLSAKSSPPC